LVINRTRASDGRRSAVPTYVSLINFTDQGIRTYQDTVERSENYREMVEKAGGRILNVLWTLGEYDLVSVLEAPDDETATSVSLEVCSMGNIRTNTMRAFDAEEMGAIVARRG
jgi:uncharacterized protein with GYD domain